MGFCFYCFCLYLNSIYFNKYLNEWTTIFRLVVIFCTFYDLNINIKMMINLCCYEKEI